MADMLALQALEAAAKGPQEELVAILAKIEAAVGEGHSHQDLLDYDLRAATSYARNIVGMGGRMGRIPKQASAYFYQMVATPMTAAAAAGHEGHLRVLMDFTNRTGVLSGSIHLALAAACMAGHERCARMLIEAGARSDLQDGSGKTPLHLAAMAGHAGCAAELIAAGAGPSAQDDDGHTPLALAMKRGFAPCAEILLPYSLPVTAMPDGVTAAHWAAEGGDPACMAMVLDMYPRTADCADDWGTTPLMLAAAAGSPECVKMLLPYSRVSAEDENCRSALWMAARHGPSCVPLLIPGSNLEARDDDGHLSALATAISWGYVDAVKALLEAGANPMTRDANRATCLHMAAQAGPEMVELILPGSDPYARDEEGRTPLIEAVCYDGLLSSEKKAEQVVRLLLPVSDPDARDDDGMTAAEMARHRGNHGMAALIDGLILSQKESQELGAAIGGAAVAKAKLRM